MPPRKRKVADGADAAHAASVPKAPRDAQRVRQLLEAMGVRSYEPLVAQQLLEFMHRYVAEVFDDAADYTEHAGRSEITVEDTRLALSLAARTGDIRRRPLPGMLAEMAAACNRKKLPEQSRQRQLPGPRDSFVHDGRTRNWQVVIPARQQTRTLPEFTASLGAADSERRQRQPAKRIEVRLAPPGVAPTERVQPLPANLQDILARRSQPAADYDDDDEMWDDERDAQ
mmetsp:Transcript_1355/g.3520  ORF Transcript_1355/g.3520 Transcript_1355/m.3520 type:complete len:228 (+) Transcript_1355:38-721(+)